MPTPYLVMLQVSGLVVCLLLAMGSSAQNALEGSLGDTTIRGLKGNFYIASVTDDRSNSAGNSVRGREGEIMTFTRLQPALTAYYQHIAPQKPSAIPIAVRIIKCSLSQTRHGAVAAPVLFTETCFYFDTFKVYTAKGGAIVSARNNMDAALTANLRKSLASAITSFARWWDVNKLHYPLYDSVSVNVMPGHDPYQDYDLPFSKHRPLQIGDFRGAVDESSSMKAVTYAGIRFEQRITIKGGYFQEEIRITPGFDAHSSWFKHDENSSSILSHEQLHFDIQMLYASRAIEKLIATKWTKLTFLNGFDSLKAATFRDAMLEENRYDAETQHGTKTSEQAKWSERIKQEMEHYGYFP